MSDLIRREDVVEAIYEALRTPLPNYNNDFFHNSMSIAMTMANSIPSTEPEQKKGKWIDGILYQDFDESEWEKVKCSVCKNFVIKPIFYHDNKYHFCPYCGADMRGDK